MVGQAGDGDVEQQGRIFILGDGELTSCVWLLGTAGAAADAGELKRLLPDSMGKTPGVVDEVTEPIDEPMKEGISPAPEKDGVSTR